MGGGQPSGGESLGWLLRSRLVEQRFPPFLALRAFRGHFFQASEGRIADTGRFGGWPEISVGG